mmetsp:Transcript_40196/g.94511  ORF Transcript_40196/g.94511 Transcript_40196/m.94511 type:complete len:227 (-) Transcript_40196:102-782(-)
MTFFNMCMGTPETKVQNIPTFTKTHPNRSDRSDRSIDIGTLDHAQVIRHNQNMCLSKNDDNDTSDTDVSNDGSYFSSNISHSDSVADGEQQEKNEHHAKKVEEKSPEPRVPNRRVSFSTIEIYEHPLTMGDNPSCSCGPPTTLHWKCLSKELHNVDDYEEMMRIRQSDENSVQTYSYCERKNILRQKGYTKEEILACQKNAEKIHKQRTKSYIAFEKKPFWKVLKL